MRLSKDGRVISNTHSDLSSMTRRSFVRMGAVSAGALCASGLLAESRQARPSEHDHLDTENHTKFSIRIGPASYVEDQAFDSLLHFLKRQRSLIDEICLFDASTVLVYIPAEWIDKTTSVMTRRFDAFRKAGFSSVGVNVLATIGHGDEACEGLPIMPLPPMVGLDGTQSRGCACPAQPAYRRYICAKYLAYAHTGADFLWVDDDFRMQSHSFAGKGIDWGCFCEHCLQIFGQESGHTFSREELTAALNAPENPTLRQEWVAHNGRVLESVLTEISETVRSFNPAIAMGSMTLGPSFTSYSNSTVDKWMTALGATKARPGEGFYWDTLPGSNIEMVGANRLDALTKAFEISRQNSMYPARVTDRQAEYETFPYGSLLKNPQTCLNECLLAIASGCNGVALNTFGLGGTYEEYEPLFQKLTQARPILEAVLSHGYGLPEAGLWSAWSPNVMGRQTIRANESWFTSNVAYDMNLTTALTAIGVPLSAERCGLGTVLTGRIAESFDDDELRSLLAEGAMLDTLALRVLTERGMNELTGVKVASNFSTSVNARLTGDPLNGANAGAIHDAHQLLPEAFRSADTLELLDPNVRVLAELQDFFSNRKGPCMTAYENRLGGRVVVIGYSPWWYLQSAFKRFQTVNVADWIARGWLPVRIDETCALAPLIRMNNERTRGVIVLLNTALGPVETATVRLRIPEKTRVRLASTSKDCRMEVFHSPDGWGAKVRNIDAWSTASLLLG